MSRIDNFVDSAFLSVEYKEFLKVLSKGATMKKLLMVAIFLFSLVGISYGAIIDNSNIVASGTLYPGGWYGTLGGPENTIDDNLDTSWRGTDDIQVGETNYLAYQFNQQYSILRIDFYDSYSNSYRLGELDIQISQNSTDGLDGSWDTIDHIAGDFNPSGGDFSRFVDIESTSWVRLWMTYQGRAGWGSTPTLMLSEIDFDGTPSVIPEPSSLFLLGLGGLLLKRRKM